MLYAVIDTNVLVSSFLSRHKDSATVRVVQAVVEGRITPLYNDEIIAEYREVLARDYIKSRAEHAEELIDLIEDQGLSLDPKCWTESMPDESDRVFFEVALSAQDAEAKLVTGNTKHFPQVHFVITPSQMLSLLASSSK